MAYFLIGTHGKMASGVKNALSILLGDCPNVYVVDAYCGNSDLEEEIAKFYACIPENEQVFLLSDLFGGSVSNTFFKYVDRLDTTVISGFNLALVLELVSQSDGQRISNDELNDSISRSQKALLVVKNRAPVGDDNFFVGGDLID